LQHLSHQHRFSIDPLTTPVGLSRFNPVQKAKTAYGLGSLVLQHSGFPVRKPAHKRSIHRVLQHMTGIILSVFPNLSTVWCSTYLTTYTMRCNITPIAQETTQAGKRYEASKPNRMQRALEGL
jgi:hypothetical protein